MNKNIIHSEDAFIPALAALALVIFFIIVVATIIPPIKQTALDFLNAIFK